jgi:tetratricopeptide (TPR) repeat protein
MGDRAGAAKTFEAALVAANKETKSADGRNFSLQNIAEAQAKVGMFNEAFKTVDRMRGWDVHPVALEIKRGQALTFIATEQFAAGDLKGALATARLVPWSYARLANAHARTGDVEGARRTIEEAIREVNKESNKEFQALALAEIAEAQVLLGDAKAAIDSAERIEFKPSRAGVLTNIASIQKTRNDHAGAIETVKIALSVIRGLEHPLTRAQFLLWIANTLE